MRMQYTSFLFIICMIWYCIMLSLYLFHTQIDYLAFLLYAVKHLCDLLNLCHRASSSPSRCQNELANRYTGKGTKPLQTTCSLDIGLHQCIHSSMHHDGCRKLTCCTILYSHLVLRSCILAKPAVSEEERRRSWKDWVEKWVEEASRSFYLVEV